MVVDVGDEDAPAAVALGIAEGDDEVVVIPQAQESAEVVHLVLVVAVREADPLEAGGLEAGAQGLAVAQVPFVVDRPHARQGFRETVRDLAGPVR